MPETRTTVETVYKFEELSDRAKEKAREDYRLNGLDYDWWDSSYEDFERIAAILGIELKQKPVPLMSGATRYDPSIWFQLSYCQGDGASFDGDYSYAKGAHRKIRAYAPKDAKLHAMADSLLEVQRRSRYKLTARLKSHRDTSVDVETFTPEGDYANIGADKAVTEVMRNFAQWIYDSLRAEYEWLTADEQIDETIDANDWQFYEDGRLA